MIPFRTYDIPGLVLFEPPVRGDSRGWFAETFRDTWLAGAGIRTTFVQDNLSRSSRGVLRGLHYQLTQPQAKLIRVAEGRVLDVAVDVRRGSPTFGRHLAVELSDTNGHLFYIPEGFAHGFVVLSDTCVFSYKCGDYYHPAGERGLKWDDPALGIDWGILDPLVSPKDASLPTLDRIPESDLPIWKP